MNMEWFFKRMAHEYSFKVINANEHPFRTFQAAFLDQHLKPDYTVVDLGCKYGDISKRISPFCKHVIGIDHDALAITQAQKLNQAPNIQYECVDLFEYLDKNNQSVDVILLSHVLEHVDEPEKLLQKLTQYTTYLFIELPDFESIYLNEYRKIYNVYLNYEDDDHVTEFDRIDLMNKIHASGFKILESEFRHGMMRFWCESTFNSK